MSVMHFLEFDDAGQATHINKYVYYNENDLTYYNDVLYRKDIAGTAYDLCYIDDCLTDPFLYQRPIRMHWGL